MADPTRTRAINELTTLTYDNRRTEVANQIVRGTALTDWLMRKGSIRYESGGLELQIPINVGWNPNLKAITTGGHAPMNPANTVRYAYYDWKYIVISIVRYWTDLQKNRGVQALKKIVTHDIDVARDTFMENFETYFFGDGTADGGFAPEGLGNLIDTTPATGTVGGIDSSTLATWQNKQKTSTGAAALYLRSDLRALRNECSAGKNDYPDAYVTDDTSAELYEAETEEQRRVMNQDTGDTTFTDITYKRKPVFWSPQATAGNWYMLNSKHLELIVDPAYEFEMTEWKTIPDQVFDSVAQMVWVGNFVSDMRNRLGVLTAIAA